MRILIYSPSFAPQIGGVETYVKLLAEGLARHSAEHGDSLDVTVVTTTPAGNCDDGSLPFRVVRNPSWPQLLGLIWSASILHLAGPCFLPMVVGLCLRKPVIVEQHGYQAVCPNGLLLHQPTKAACPGHFMAGSYLECIRCNSMNWGRTKSWFKLIATFPRRWVCSLGAVNLPITHHVDQRLALPGSKVIYYGIPDPFAAEPPDPAGGLPASRPFTFAYVGRLVSEKGLPLLIQAAGRLKDEGYQFRLKLIGDGPEGPGLKDLTASLGVRDRVTFTGALAGSALQAAVSDVDGIVMPSVWEETAGLAAMEQMMNGRLVIASEIGGLGEIVGTAGLRFAPGDVGALTACLTRALEDPELVRRMGLQARNRALLLFRQERMVEDHLGVYRFGNV
jgi:glycogen(starch) synthase